MTENEDYTITVSITSIDNAAQPQGPSDDFILPSVNSTTNSTTSTPTPLPTPLPTPRCPLQGDE